MTKYVRYRVNSTTAHGILDGDTVKICFAHAGNPRPTEFTTNGSDDKMITLKHAKE